MNFSGFLHVACTYAFHHQMAPRPDEPGAAFLPVKPIPLSPCSVRAGPPLRTVAVGRRRRKPRGSPAQQMLEPSIIFVLEPGGSAVPGRRPRALGG